MATDGPVMHYFPFAGRGELTRLIAAAGELKLGEVTVGGEAADRKELCASCGCVGTGLPVLTHGDLKMCQSGAIQNYIALIGPKFADLSAGARAVDMMWCAHLEDFIGDASKSGIFGLLMAGNKDGFKKEALNETLTKYFDLFERLCPAEGFVNKQEFPTCADCVAVYFYEAAAPVTHFYKHGEFDNSAYPKLKALSERAVASPLLKAYVASSTTLKFDPFSK